MNAQAFDMSLCSSRSLCMIAAAATANTTTALLLAVVLLGCIAESISNSAYSDQMCLHTVRLSVCLLSHLSTLDEIRCHWAGTLVWSQTTLS